MKLQNYKLQIRKLTESVESQNPMGKLVASFQHNYLPVYSFRAAVLHCM
jgi:hypothetical protein